MNRTLKEYTVKRNHYESHVLLREHLDSFVNTYNLQRDLSYYDD